jgi:hypothetical protein
MFNVRGADVFILIGRGATSMGDWHLCYKVLKVPSSRVKCPMEKSSMDNSHDMVPHHRGTIWYHITEEQRPLIHHCENLKSCISGVIKR